MATSEWLRFFEDAGIPPGPALGYAVAFVDNRIHKNMLLDLTKELMKELGITVVGDVIAILRHAKVVHRQEMCRAASESLQPEAAGGSRRDPLDPRDQWDHQRDHQRDPQAHRDHQRDPQAHRDHQQDQQDPRGHRRDLRDLQDHQRDPRDPRDHQRDPRDPQGPRDPPRAPCGAAGRMITKSLRRDPPRAPRNPPGAGICVTVPNGAGSGGAEAPLAAPKRRRVTAEAEGKYVIQLPKGTTARSRHLLRLHAARGLGRPSVFERLGAEAKAAAATGAKPSGVFSRLGAAPEGPEPAAPADPGPGDPADPEALPYAGVLKKRRECSGTTATAAQDGAVSSSGGGAWGCGHVSSSDCGPRSVFRRLGRKPD